MGGYWEAHCEAHLKSVGFESIPNWRSAYIHKKLKLALVIYVDDFKMSGPRNGVKQGWALIRKGIVTDEPCPLSKYLGCKHRIYEVPRSEAAKFVHSNPDADACLLYTSPSPRDRSLSRMPSSA